MPLEIISGYSNNDAGANVRATMFGEDSNVVRSGIENGNIYLLNAWTRSESGGGQVQIMSPRMHDNVNGIQFPLVNTSNSLLELYPNMQKLITQDSLNIFLDATVGAAAYAYIHLLIFYEDLPSSQGNYITYDELRQNKGQIMTLFHDITPDSNVDYSGGEVITTNQDSFRANESYAFLGFKFNDAANNSAMCLRGHDTGNLRIGQPMNQFNTYESELFFKYLGKMSGLKVIPVIRSANKDNTFLDMSAADTLAKVEFFSYWELMS